MAWPKIRIVKKNHRERAGSFTLRFSCILKFRRVTVAIRLYLARVRFHITRCHNVRSLLNLHALRDN